MDAGMPQCLGKSATQHLSVAQASTWLGDFRGLETWDPGGLCSFLHKWPPCQGTSSTLPCRQIA